MVGSNNTNSATGAQTRRLRVAIIGGGIGGLALATFLAISDRSSDFDIAIYEQKQSLTELGAGVGIWLRTWKIMSSAGLAEDLKAIAPKGRVIDPDGLGNAFEYRRGDRSPEGLTFYDFQPPFGLLTLHRADFQRAIAKHAIPPAHPHFEKRLVGYEYADENDVSSEIILKFADGSTERVDLLVGADGIHSAVRHEMVRRLVNRGILDLDSDVVSDLVEPVWSGTTSYRCLIPFEELEKRFPGHRVCRRPVCYIGKNQHIISYPITSSSNTSEGTNPAQDLNVSETSTTPHHVSSSETTTTRPMVNLVVFVSEPSREGTRLPKDEKWVRPAKRDEILDKFKGWEDEVVAMIELAEKPLAWAIHTLKPLPRYSDADGRVVILGDAAHAMTPHLGSGAGQAIEDAYVLASLLAHPRTSQSTIPDVLRAHDAVRVPFSQFVVEGSRIMGMMYELNHSWVDGEGGSSELRQDGGEEKDNGPNKEMIQLRKLADAMYEIHRWIWEDEKESQTEKAARLFMEYLSKRA